MTPRAQKRKTMPWVLLCIVMLGMVLRVLYLGVTPFNVREHDVWGHIGYIQYVATYWRIPPPTMAWEAHQMPLYYFLVAPWGALSSWAGLSQEAFLLALQWFSVALSIAAVLVAIWIGRQIFSHKERRWFLLNALLLATFPGLIIMAPLISNDALFTLFSFLTFGQIVRFWKHGTTQNSWLTIFLLMLTWITKANAMALVPVYLCCLAVHAYHRASLRRHAIGVTLALAVLLPSLPLMRHFTAGGGDMFAGSYPLREDVLLPTTAGNMLTFNPIAFVPIPYANAFQDASRRQYFFEYFYRTAFFGEWDFGDALKPLASVLVGLGLVLLLFAAIGLLADLRSSKGLTTLPFWLATVLLILSVAVFRLRDHCSCNQDFRFAPLLAVTTSAYAVLGVLSLRPPMRTLAVGLVITFSLLSALFFVLVSTEVGV